ncbi:MAG: hypothetical protein ACLSAH_22460 [Bilophila wadsworthia]
MNTTFHAFCLAAPRSGEGKTTTGIALMRALARRGLKVQSFKCGPDYIDPTFHAQATGRPACNLDTWMMGREGVRTLWDNRAHDADACVCEGVMGLFDSRDPGDPAAPPIAPAPRHPVVLVFNARGMACSAAALVAGSASRFPDVQLAGVIANNVGSPRHADILRRASKANASSARGLARNEAWRIPNASWACSLRGSRYHGGVARRPCGCCGILRRYGQAPEPHRSPPSESPGRPSSARHPAPAHGHRQGQGVLLLLRGKRTGTRRPGRGTAAVLAA